MWVVYVGVVSGRDSRTEAVKITSHNVLYNIIIYEQHQYLY